jgi:hypothetical protein
VNLTTPGVVLFDPKTFSPPLNPAGDNVFNFTTINIASGVTLRLSANLLTGPVYFLATGAVTINGTIDLSGANGHQAGSSLTDRIPAAPGPGGYGGGVGGNSLGGTFPPTAGNGPGGGVGGAVGGQGTAVGGTFTGSQFLIPLIGGSGGGGEQSVFGCGTPIGGGGGAGGGALLVASSATITINGTVNANGGTAGCDGGHGSGGAIRLVASSIAGNGLLTARGIAGCGGCGSGSSNGQIRLEAEQQNFAGTFNSTPVNQSPPFKIVLPATPPPSVRVISIAGIPINSNPFTFPDAVINSSSTVAVVIEARYVPPGTVPKLFTFSENVADQAVTAPALAGTLQLSTSTVNVTIPPGGSRGFVKVTW